MGGTAPRGPGLTTAVKTAVRPARPTGGGTPPLEKSDRSEYEILVPRAGVEPARGCPQRFLSSITPRTRSFAGVRPEYKSTLSARSSVRRRSPKFALTAVKLLSDRPSASINPRALQLPPEAGARRSPFGDRDPTPMLDQSRIGTKSTTPNKLHTAVTLGEHPSSSMETEMSALVLVVDDDPKIVSLVKIYLERDGLRVRTATDGRAALAALAESPPSLIVLDLMLPEIDGLALMRMVREQSDVPILMLSARGSVADRVYGIHEGADDYLGKPFSPAELVVRVKAVLRRTAGRFSSPGHGIIECGALKVDLDRMLVHRGVDVIARHLARLLPPGAVPRLLCLASARREPLAKRSVVEDVIGSICC